MDKTSTKIDIYVVLLLINIFALINFLYFNINAVNIVDFIMLGIMFFIIMVAYFNGLVYGLIGSAFVMFTYASYIIYGSMVLGKNVQVTTYIWMLFIPINTIVMGNLQSNISILQDTNIKLKKDYKELITIDEITKLDNIKSFYTELDREISMFKRHNLIFSLMIIKIQYFDELNNLLGENRMGDFLKSISNCIIDATRNEDKRYKLSKDKLAIIMPNTDFKGSEVVKDRIRDSIRDINLKIKEKGKNVNIDVKIGILEYSSNIKDGFEFKEMSEKELEYDV